MSVGSWDCEEWREDGGGSVIALHIPSHVDLYDATQAAWAWGIDYDNGVSLRRGGPIHTWLRKVPWHREEEALDGGWDGTMQYVLCGPGPGATPITYIDFAHPWDKKRCHHWPACHESAASGIPIERFINPPTDVRYVYFCRRHARDVNERLEVARATSALGITE